MSGNAGNLPQEENSYGYALALNANKEGFSAQRVGKYDFLSWLRKALLHLSIKYKDTVSRWLEIARTAILALSKFSLHLEARYN